MAVTKLNQKDDGTFNFYMLAADTAPTTGVPNGSRLIIVDTPEEFIFLDGAWYSTEDGAAPGA